jgi:hypothetical protein
MLALGTAGATALLTLGGIPVAASGVLPGASLTELATYIGWRRTWDLFVPLLVERSVPRTCLLYDRAAGEATVIAVDEGGNFNELRRLSGWRRTWDNLTPSGFPRLAGVTGLIAYDSTAGLFTAMEVDAFGNVEELWSESTWRKSWSAFAPVGAAGLLAYDRGAGYGTLFSLDASGMPREIRSYNDWRQTWDIITTGPFTSGAMLSGDVLFYDRAARQALGLTFLGNGDTSTFAEYSGWRQSWTSIAGGLFLFHGTTGSMTADLMHFDETEQELEFLDIGPDSSLVSILLTATPGSDNWTKVTPLGPDLLLLYDRATGTAAFYATNRAALAPPSPTPAPPAPTPIPPTPTPAIVPTGRLDVELEQGRGNDWNTYTGRTSDPVDGGSRTAFITGVKNTSNKRISLLHRERDNTRTGPVFVKEGEVSPSFNGMEVAGDWEAKVTTSEADAPRRVTLEIRYEVR